jgi:nucleoside diphosphate kinase
MTEMIVWTPSHAMYTPLQVKPDGVQRGLVGEILGRFERKGFTLRGLKLFTPGRELAEDHYKDLSQKPFFKDLVDYITSGPVVAMVRTAPHTRASVKLPCLAARHSQWLAPLELI